MVLVLKLTLRLWFGIALDRCDPLLEDNALRHQVEVLTRTKRRPTLRFGDRLLWMSISRG